jgi:hypothetical protein
VISINRIVLDFSGQSIYETPKGYRVAGIRSSHQTPRLRVFERLGISNSGSRSRVVACRATSVHLRVNHQHPSNFLNNYLLIVPLTGSEEDIMQLVGVMIPYADYQAADRYHHGIIMCICRNHKLKAYPACPKIC